MTGSGLKHLYGRSRYRTKVWKAVLSGPPFRSDLKQIIIDLTFFCDLSCIDCNRSCGRGQASGSETISPEQIRRFISESIESGKKWERIMLEGGEPTLNPEIDRILEDLLEYKAGYSPGCEIRLCTNGYGEKARWFLASPPDGLQIWNSGKSMRSLNGHLPFNQAPADLPGFEDSDFSHGCYLHLMYGLGLNRNGYYPHPICGGIDRVFGFDIGLKSLPGSSSEMEEQMNRLCRLCGHFREYHTFRKRRITWPGKGGKKCLKGKCSVTWESAYNAYHEKQPCLTPY